MSDEEKRTEAAARVRNASVELRNSLYEARELGLEIECRGTQFIGVGVGELYIYLRETTDY